MARSSVNSFYPIGVFILTLPLIALAGWYAGAWVYSQGFGSIPAWTLLMACVSVSAGLFLARFAVPFTFVFSMALCSSVAYRADAWPGASNAEVLEMNLICFMIGLFWVAVAFLTRHRKRVPQWLDDLGKRLS